VDVFNVQTKTNIVYTPQLPTDHTFTSLLSFQTYDNKAVSNQALTSNTASSLLQDPSDPSRTPNQELGIASGFTQQRTLAALVNAQYGYKGKYIINVGLRGDANSRFGPSQRYGLFPSVSTRWRISDEKFMKQFKFINDLSFRGSYGQAGNQPKTDYSFYNQYSSNSWTYLGQSGVFPSTIELSNLKWEVINGSNLGINLIMLHNRLNIDMEMYRNRTKDLFFYNLSIPTFTGYSGVNMNVGTLDNQGWELNIMSTPLRTDNYTLDFNFNISHNENIIRTISEFYPREKGNIEGNGSYKALLQENNPFGSFYGFRYKGVYKDKAATIAVGEKGKPIIGPNGQQVYMRFNYPKVDYTFQPGDAMYEDVNRDGNIDYRDVVYLGNGNPKFTGGFGPTLTIKKSLKISAFFNYRMGVDIINGTKMNTTNMYGFGNQSTAVLRRWRKEGDVTDIPRAVWQSGYNWLGSDRYVENGSFVRLRTVTVRYTFPQVFLNRIKLKALSAYCTAENLFTFTRYTGQDPEVSTKGSDPFRVAIDYSMTPPPLVLTLGLTTTF